MDDTTFISTNNLGKCVRSVKFNRANYKTNRMPESLDYDLAKKFFV